MTKYLLLMTCATGALGLMAGAAQAATAAATDTSQGATSVTELVVTAERRERSLQKVPVAVSVFTGSQRDVIGISSVAEVTNFAPGFTYDPSNVHAYIRGIGRSSVNVTNDQRVANYEDEFYVYSPYGLDKSSLFLSQEQIERGPQNVGGRVAEGGSIDMISVRPTDQPYAEIRGTGGNFGYFKLEGAASGQLAPGLDVRFAAFDENQDQGYYKNLLPGGQSEGHVIHEWYFEGQVDWKPNDKFEFWARAFNEGWKNRGDAGSRTGIDTGTWDETVFNDGSSYIGGSLYGNINFGLSAPNGNPTANAAVVANRTALILANPGAPCPLCLGQPIVTSVSLYKAGILNNPSQLSTPNQFISPVARNVKLQGYDDFNYQATYHFNGFDFRYTGGIQGYNYYLNDPGDGDDENTNVKSFTLAWAGPVGFPGNPTGPLTINGPIQANYVEDDWWTAHDFTLQSTGDDALGWQGGLFYYFQHYNQPYQVTAKNQPQFAAPVCLGALFGLGAGSCGTPGGANAIGLPLGAGNPGLQVAYFQYKFNVETVSPYGQVSYKINDQWKLTGSLRWTWDDKWGAEDTRYLSMQALLQNNTAGNPLYLLAGNQTPTADVTQAVICSSGLGSGPGGSGANLTNAACRSGPLGYGVKSAAVIEPNGDAHRLLGTVTSAFTGGIDLDWTPTPDIFTYVRYNRGYASPSFNAGQVIANPASRSEFLNAFEGGYKQSFGKNLLLDIAAFYYDYDNIQQPFSVNNGGVISSLFINVPKAVSEGIEVEAYWTIVKDLQLTASYSFDHSEVLTDCHNPTGGISGNNLCLIDTADPNAVAPGARPVGGTTSQSVKGNELPNAPENKIALDLAYTWHFEPGSLTLSGIYAWRDKQFGSLINRFYNTAPSWDDIDFRALWKGPNDKYEIIAYVKNVLNHNEFTTGAGGTGLAGSATAIANTAVQSGNIWVTGYQLNPPRTYGLELRYKFF